MTTEQERRREITAMHILKQHEDGREDFICSICAELIKEEYSANAQPLNDGRCCMNCDNQLVIPARLKRFSRGLPMKAVFEDNPAE